MSKEKNMTKEEREAFVNPIDKDKVVENPGTLPYAHSVGGALVKPEDKGKIKGRAITAMEEQTNMHLEQIQKQIELLAKQAKAIIERKEVSEKIYLSEMGFEPNISQIYHLYERENGNWVLSLVAPHEWGRSMPFAGYVSSARLLSDHTWELI